MAFPSSNEKSNEIISKGKRSFLRGALFFVGGIVGLILLWGLGRFSLFSDGGRKVREIHREVLDKLEADVPFHVPEAGAWLLKAKSDGELTAFDDRCPHLGCRQKWNAALQLYQCPCHGSEFDIQGNVMRGPAGRPMPKLFVDSSSGDSLRLLPNPPKTGL